MHRRFQKDGFQDGSIILVAVTTFGTWRSWEASSSTTLLCKVSSVKHSDGRTRNVQFTRQHLSSLPHDTFSNFLSFDVNGVLAKDCAWFAPKGDEATALECVKTG